MLPQTRLFSLLYEVSAPWSFWVCTKGVTSWIVLDAIHMPLPSPSSYVKVLTIPQNVTALGESVFKEVIKFKQGRRVAPVQKDWCPYKKGRLGHRHTQTEEPCEDTGWRQLSVKQGGRPQKKPTPPTPWSWISSLQTLRKSVSGVEVPQSVIPCYGRPSKWMWGRGCSFRNEFDRTTSLLPTEFHSLGCSAVIIVGTADASRGYAGGAGCLAIYTHLCARELHPSLPCLVAMFMY